MRAFFLILILSIGFFSRAPADPIGDVPAIYQPLVDRLSKDGFDYEFLSRFFLDPRAEIDPSVMTLSLGSSETTGLYAQFLTPESIRLARRFLRENGKVLRQMEKKLLVEKEVIVAILLVESRFGENTGQYRVIPTLASMALMDSSENLRTNYLMLRELDPEFSYEWMENRAKKKANWAYHELKCFLKIIRNERMDPLEVRGSYAGALGMAQFIPSSYLAYAMNKESFEKWLFSKEAAIFSIGNYLKSYGWKRKLPSSKKKQVLWYYNRSEPYVGTILQVATRLEQK